MIDSHAHIYLPEFDTDSNAMLGHAKDAGVEKIFLPNIDKESIDDMLKLSRAEKDFCFPLIGLHPCSVKDDYKNELKIIQEYLNDAQYKFYGVGECGLDYYWDKTFIDLQEIAFVFQIELAKKYKLPIIIHSRDAVDDCIELVAKYKSADLQGIFHCFTGTIEQLEKIIALDFYAGIGGVVTFKNGGLDKVLQSEHLAHIVLETDAPYLAPVPFRGKRNEPAYLQYILKRLSEIININEDLINQTTSANAAKLFKL